MTSRGAQNLLGEVFGTLRVINLATAQPLRWEYECQQCGAKCTALHMRLVNGVETCRNASCGKEPRKPAGTSLATVLSIPTGVRSRDSEEARRYEPSSREVVQSWLSRNPEFVNTPENVAAMLQYFSEHNLRGNVYANHDRAFAELKREGKLKIRSEAQ